jgi:hypothetical protein
LIRAGEARLLFDGAEEPRHLDVVARMGHGIDGAAREAVVAAIDWVMDVPTGEVRPPTVSAGDASAGEV